MLNNGESAHWSVRMLALYSPFHQPEKRDVAISMTSFPFVYNDKSPKKLFLLFNKKRSLVQCGLVKRYAFRTPSSSAVVFDVVVLSFDRFRFELASLPENNEFGSYPSQLLTNSLM